MSSEHQQIKIPLDQAWFDKVDHEALVTEADRLSEDVRVRGAIAAMLDMFSVKYGDSILKTVGDDGVPVFEGLRFSVNNRPEGLTLVLDGVPVSSLKPCLNPRSGEIERRPLEQVSETMLPALMRDLLWLPNYDGPVSERKTWLKEKVDLMGVLDGNLAGVRANGHNYPVHRVSVQGGHSISRAEYKAVAEWATLLALMDPGTSFITGCGEGVMRAPFTGADVAHTRSKNSGFAQNIGLTEIGILWKEAPNPRVQHHFTAPDIESRMEAFVRMSHQLVAFPGGVGTFEEIMTNLGILMHPDNAGIEMPFYLVERRQGPNSYMDRADQFLRTCFGDRLNGVYKLCSVSGSMESAALEMIQDRKRLGFYSNPKQLWNDDLVMPEDLGQPFHPTPDRMSELELGAVSSNADAYQLMVDLRRLFSAVVHWTVKDQEGFKAWNGHRPKLEGDPLILKGFHELVCSFMREKRIPLVWNKEDPADARNFPYEIPGA